MAEEMILEIEVTCLPPLSVRGHTLDVVMVPFTGKARGPYFSGRVVGTGVDTQKYQKDGTGFLSARYMLEGADAAGTPCRVFIENQGSGEWRPRLVTDSPLLASWEEEGARATVDPAPGGVLVRIYKEVK